MFPTAPSERLRLFFPAIGSVDGAARRYPARVKRRNQMVDRFDIAADGINKEFGVLDYEIDPTDLVKNYAAIWR